MRFLCVALISIILLQSQIAVFASEKIVSSADMYHKLATNTHLKRISDIMAKDMGIQGYNPYFDEDGGNYYATKQTSAASPRAEFKKSFSEVATIIHHQ